MRFILETKICPLCPVIMSYISILGLLPKPVVRQDSNILYDVFNYYRLT